MLRQRRGSRYAAQPIMVDARLVDALRRARGTLVFSGAGISTASGIPDFRGPNGVWTRRRPVYYDEFLASESARVEYWDYKLETWDVYRQARPNAAHDAVVALERARKVAAVVTQNVDGLHRRAGTSPSLLVELHGTDLLVECQSCHAASEFQRLCRAGDLLRAARDRPVSIREAAAAAGMSPFHFIRRFRALFGETPHQFLIRARLDRAKRLLASSDRSVTDVCLEVGFTSLGSFSDQFARRVGMAPSAYRRQARGRHA